MQIITLNHIYVILCFWKFIFYLLQIPIGYHQRSFLLFSFSLLGPAFNSGVSSMSLIITVHGIFLAMLVYSPLRPFQTTRRLSLLPTIHVDQRRKGHSSRRCVYALKDQGWRIPFYHHLSAVTCFPFQAAVTLLPTAFSFFGFLSAASFLLHSSFMAADYNLQIHLQDYWLLICCYLLLSSNN